MVLSACYAKVRKLVAHCLSNNQALQGTLHSPDSIATICNNFIEGTDVVTGELVISSFSGEGEGWGHLQLAPLLDIEYACGDLDLHVLSYNKFRPDIGDGRVTSYAIGCFESEDLAIANDPQSSLDEQLNAARVRRMDLKPPPRDLVKDVVQMIAKKRKKDAKKARKKKSEKRKSNDAQLDPPTQPTPPQPNPPSDEDLRMQQFRNQTTTVVDLLLQQRALEAKLQEEQAKFIALRDEINGYTQCDYTPPVDKSSKEVLFLLDGRPGKLQVSPNDVVLYQDFVDSTMSEEQVAAKESLFSIGKDYSTSWHGRQGCWVPKWTKITTLVHSFALQKHHQYVTKFINIFKGKYTGFSRSAKRLMALFFTKANNVSGASKEAIMNGTIKAILHDTGLSEVITDEMMANGVPSENTFARMELDLAVDCTALNVNEIKEESKRRGKPTVLGLMIDHANKKNKGFFAKLLVYCAFVDGEWVLRFFCLDVDDCDHTAEAAALAIQKSLNNMGLEMGEDYVLELLTSDSGGGAAVHRTFQALIDLMIMNESCRFVKCMMHAMNKAFEMACLDCFGAQGVNRRTMTQMFWLVICMFQGIKKKGGMKLFDEIYAVAIEMMTSDAGWKEEGLSMFLPAMKDFFDTLNKDFDLSTEEGVDAKEKFTTKAPRGFTRPTLSRWRTMSAVGKLVKKFYAVIYYMAIAVIRSEKSTKYLRIIATELVSLMVVQPKTNSPTADEEEAAAADADEFESKTVAELKEMLKAKSLPVSGRKNELIGRLRDAAAKERGVDEVPPLSDEDTEPAVEDDTNSACDEEEFTPTTYKPGDTPPLYACTVFFVAFCEEFFDDMFDWYMRNDPILGDGSYGQTSRLCPERGFVVHKALLELENGGWRNKARFQEFLSLIPGIISTGSVMDGGREFVEKVPDQFLTTFRYFLNKHAIDPWRTPMLAVLVIGGNPIIAKHCLRLLFNSSYSVPNETIELAHHEVRNGPIHVNVAELVAFVIGDILDDNIDVCPIFSDKLIQADVAAWRAFSESPSEVEILNRATWRENDDFTSLQEIVMGSICPLPSQQQRIENILQMAGRIAATGVGEKRLSWRAINDITFARRFNEYVLEHVNSLNSSSVSSSESGIETARDEEAENIESEPRPTKIKRVRGSLLWQLLGEEATKFSRECEAARTNLGDEEVNKIKERLNNADNKASAEQRKKYITEVREAVRNVRRNPTKGERKAGIDVTAEMGGGIKLQKISYTNMGSKENAEAVVRAELNARGKQYTDAQWASMDWKAKKKELQTDEAEKALHDDRGLEGLVVSNINSIIPQSAELKAYLIDYEELSRRLESLEEETNEY